VGKMMAASTAVVGGAVHPHVRGEDP